MTERDKSDVHHLRSTAAKFRAMAMACITLLSPALMKMAGDLDQQADELDARIPTSR